MVLPIVAVAVEVLLYCLNSLFSEFICLQLVGGGKVYVNIELAIL